MICPQASLGVLYDLYADLSGGILHLVVSLWVALKGIQHVSVQRGALISLPADYSEPFGRRLSVSETHGRRRMIELLLSRHMGRSGVPRSPLYMYSVDISRLLRKQATLEPLGGVRSRGRARARLKVEDSHHTGCFKRIRTCLSMNIYS